MEQKRNRYNKRKFLITFTIVMGLFAAIRHVFSLEIPLRGDYIDTQYLDEESDWANMEMEGLPDEFAEASFSEDESYAEEGIDGRSETDEVEIVNLYTENDSTDADLSAAEEEQASSDEETQNAPDSANTKKKHNKIKGVYSYDKCFPDINDVQLSAASRYGIKPVKNRKAAERLVRARKLVNISHSPFYRLDNLTHSMPYLVPRAQQLLNTICINFIDSCQAKGLPAHLPVVTSVLRTSSDVAKLQRGNKNATTNSCHCYGTTVDISYVKFEPVVGYHDPSQELTRWDEPMKRVLSEVLYDLREQNKCYVKYERKQACFHLTCR